MKDSRFEDLKNNNPFKPLGEIIYQHIYEDIISLKIPPNAKLNESKIAESLNVSRSPVKYALGKLADDKLVIKNEGKISVVPSMGKDESRQLLEARIAIEGYAAYLAANRITQEQLNDMNKLVRQYEGIGESINPDTYADCDHDFHAIIINAARNEFIGKMYNDIESRLRHYRHCLLHEIGAESLQPILFDAAKHHKSIYNALKLGFADIAKNEIERDINGMAIVFSEWK